MIALGVLTLLGLNLGGILLIWFGERVQRYRPRFRVASLILLGVSAAACVLVAVWATIAGTVRMNITSPVSNWVGPPIWMAWAFGTAGTVIYGLPIWWLMAPGTRSAFAAHSELASPRLCPNCTYDLRGSRGSQCPECGEEVSSPAHAPGEQV